MSRSRASASAAPGLVAFAALAVLRACSAQATTLDALQARLDALTPPPCGSGSYLIYTNGAWTCSPAQACAAPPACAPPGGARLLYDTTTGWFCECTSGWSGASCSVFNATAAAPSTQVLLQSVLTALQASAQSAQQRQFCGPLDDPVQCQALVSFAQSLRYSTWYNGLTSFKIRGTDWLTTNSYCTWVGVQCGGANGGDVVGIELAVYGGAAGQISPSLANLTALQYLGLGWVYESGSILQKTRITGSVPPQVAQLSSLKGLFLGGTAVACPTNFANPSACCCIGGTYGNGSPTCTNANGAIDGCTVPQNRLVY